ncbi:MAG: peptidoglycan DD-metalloendopeptidase family protein [Lachnospiraceae bacterium]
MKDNKNSFKEIFMKNRKAYISVFVCLFVVYALLVIGIGSTGEKNKNNPGDGLNENSIAQKQDDTNSTNPTGTGDTGVQQPEITSIPVTPVPESETAGSSGVEVVDNQTSTGSSGKVSFNPEDGIAWPVEGDIIMDYSVDHGVYHETLCQFMTNDGLLIDSQNGEMAKSCCDAVVTDIYTDTRRGKCVELTAGDYRFVYGQLSTISVNEGDTVSEGVAVGMVGEPTKYYSEEGAHLYFKVICGDETVNPSELLRE